MINPVKENILLSRLIWWGKFIEIGICLKQLFEIVSCSFCLIVEMTHSNIMLFNTKS